MKRLIAVAGVLISAAALWWALQGIDFAAVGQAFGQIRWGWFALGLIPWVLTIASKVFRWRLLYYPDQRAAPYPRLAAALLIGYLFNTVLPLRTGELVRATVLRATAGLPVARTLSTILVEKVLDTMTLVAMLGAILPFIRLPAAFQRPALLAAIAFGGLFVVVLTAAVFPAAARGLIAWLLPLVPARLRPAVLRISDQVLDGLLPLRRREVAPGIAAWTLFTWGTNVLATYFFLVSFGLVLPPAAPALVVVATNLVMTVPSAPGYVGVYHATAKQALLVFGVPPDLALAFATVLHATGFLPLALAGLLSMVREGLSFGAVQAGTRGRDAVISGQWSVVSGEDGAANSRDEVVSGQWPVVSDGRSAISAGRAALSGQRPAVSDGQLTLGDQPSAESKIQNPKSKIQNPPVGSGPRPGV